MRQLCLGLVLYAVMMRQADGAAWQVGKQEASSEFALNIDGDLHVRYNMADILVQGFRYSLAIRHRVENDLVKGCTSVWRLQGIETCVVPATRDTWRWVATDGREHKFVRPTETDHWYDQAEGKFSIRRTSTNYVEIKNEDGVVWRYFQGMLMEICLHGGYSLVATSEGGVVVSLSLRAPSKFLNLFTVIRDELGRVVVVKAGGNEYEISYEASSRRLVSLHDTRGKLAVTAEYQGGLLNKVTSFGESHLYGWSGMDELRRRRLGLAHQVYLARDNQQILTHAVNDDGRNVTIESDDRVVIVQETDREKRIDISERRKNGR